MLNSRIVKPCRFLRDGVEIGVVGVAIRWALAIAIVGIAFSNASGQNARPRVAEKKMPIVQVGEQDKLKIDLIDIVRD